MKRSHFIILSSLVALTLLNVGCHQEDPGPLQSGTRSFSVMDFDRIEASDAVDVTLQQGRAFSIDTHGDRRSMPKHRARVRLGRIN